jgi:hypothetical protein
MVAPLREAQFETAEKVLPTFCRQKGMKFPVSFLPTACRQHFIYTTVRLVSA